LTEAELWELDSKVERLRSRGYPIGRVFVAAQIKPDIPKPKPRCKVCGEPEGKRKLHRDHCHATGAQRALLCHRCNIALGMIQDDPETARALADYLESYAPKVVYSTPETVSPVSLK
jgi:hypothetical protein